MDLTDDESFYNALNAKVDVARVVESRGGHFFTLDSLYQKWLISPEAARRTVQHTTQRGIRTILHPSLLQQFKTNDLALRYNRLQHSFFTNTMQTGTDSRRGNIYAQVYSTKFC